MNSSDYIYKRSIITLFLTLFLASCTIDTDRFSPDKEEGEEIAFTLRMPVQSAGTRAMSDEDENRVTQVDILVFRPVDNQFVEVVSTDKIEDDENEINLKTFYVRLRGETTLNLVILGNSQDILRAAFPDDEDMKGLTKDEILSELVLSYEGPWVDPQGKAIRPFPMWGFRDNANVKDDDFTGEENAIRMTRMVVRIDVHVSDAAQDEFKLNEVYLYNSYLSGKLVHSMGSGWDVTEHKATEPDIPVTATSKWRVDYIDSPSPVTTPGISSEKVIYTLEAPKGDENALLETTALVVGGIYESEQYYYRVDFAATNKENKIDFIPLVRNHNYEIHIQEVKGKGYLTPDDAFRKGMTNMELDILAWNEAGMGDITFGAQYQLTVNTDSFFFYSNGREQILKVYTDHPDGWVVVKENESDLPWLKIDPLYGDPEESVEIKLSAEELAAPLTDRFGFFYIQAGNLRKKIKVYQSLEAELYLEVEPTLLIFRKSAVVPQTVTVTVDPADRPVYLSWAGTDQLQWRSGGWPVTGQTGQTIYSFHPESNTTRNLHTGTITFNVSDDTGKSTSRIVTVVHLPTDTRFDVEYQYDPYPAAGGDPLWILTSAEEEWQITRENITLEGVMTDQLVPENYDLHPAENYKYYNFKLERNPTFAERIVNLRVTSPEPTFAPVDVPIVQDYVRPSLKITNMNYLDVDISHETPDPVDIIFTVNTDWKYVTQGNHPESFFTVIPADTDQPGGGPFDPQEVTVTFTPKTFYQEVGTPSGGTRFMGTTTFTTTNHLLATPSTQVVDFMQAVPFFMDRSTFKVRETDSSNGKVFSEGELFPASGATVYVELGTNSRWGIRALRTGESGGDTRTFTTFYPWDIHRYSLTISENPSFFQKDLSFTLYNYQETRNGVLHIGQTDATPLLVLKQDHSYWAQIVSEPALPFTSSEHEYVFTIPHTGGSYEFKLEGYFPGGNINTGIGKPTVLLINPYTGDWPAEGKAPDQNGGISGTWIIYEDFFNPGDYQTVATVNVSQTDTERVLRKIALGVTDKLLMNPIEWVIITIKQEAAPN